MALSDNVLTGLRVLVVEDEMMLAMLLESTLHELGCEVVGPVCRLNDGVHEAQESAMDCAVLDVNLGGTEVFPVCDALIARAISFVFGTGYGDVGIPEKYRSYPVLQKPFIIEQLALAIKQVIGRN